MTDKTAAFKTSSNRTKPASTFIQVNEDSANGSELFSCLSYEGGDTKAAKNGSQ
jgi:hypothetical protein